MSALPASIAHLFQEYVPSRSYEPVRSSRAPSTATSRLIAKLAMHQNYLCSICGNPLRLDVKTNNPNGVTCDHVVPRAKGGGNNGNRLAAHQLCNTSKSDRMPTGCQLVLLDAVNARLGLIGDSA